MVRLGRICFDWQIGLIGLSALAGLLIAYNQQMAARQFAIVVISIGVYLAFANIADPLTVFGHSRRVLPILLAGLPMVIVVISLFTINWSRWIDKLPALGPIMGEMAARLPDVSGPGLDPNVTGGALAALLPLQFFALRRVRRWVSVPLMAVTLIALLLSQTRGAWLALLLVTGMWLMWQVITNHVSDERRARRFWIAAVTGGAVALIALLIVTPIGERLIDLGGDRRAIWRNSLDLISDYPLTGLGLAGFDMAYSTYVLLIHVGHTTHAHNLWLDMWLNQGVVGMIALAGIIINALWPKPASVWRRAALSSLGVMVLHSLIDDPFYGYGGVALPVLFIPLGLLARPAQGPINAAEKRTQFQPALAVWAATLGLLAVCFISPQGQALIEANSGALSQTQAELSVYDWPAVPIQDALRQTGEVELTSAIQHYENALIMDPANATANRRLGQIELAREEIEAACRRLVKAYQAAPQQRATLQLLGECYALDDQPHVAATLWRTIDTQQAQLSIRRWWYEGYMLDAERVAKLDLAMGALVYK